MFLKSTDLRGNIEYNVQLNAGRPKGVWLLANVVISFPFVALIS
jgi:hypothetical protein